MKEERVGVVSHYYTKIGVAVLEMEGPLAVGDTIHVKGHTSDFTQTVASMQMEHETVPEVRKGERVGIKVIEHVREHDIVYKVLEE